MVGTDFFSQTNEHILITVNRGVDSHKPVVQILKTHHFRAENMIHFYNNDQSFIFLPNSSYCLYALFELFG